jgi:hypothetical protein
VREVEQPGVVSVQRVLSDDPQPVDLGAVVGENQPAPVQVRSSAKNDRLPGLPACCAKWTPSSPDSQADEAEHAHDVRGDPGGRRERPGAVQRGLVGVRAESRVEDEEDSGDRERDGGHGARGIAAAP